MPESKTWSRVVAELLALHETFRRLGFPADDLFVHTYTSGQVQFALMRKEEQFTIDVGRVESVEDLRKEWLSAIEWWNSKDASTEEQDRIYHFSKTKLDQPMIVAALHKRKFLPL